MSSVFQPEGVYPLFVKVQSKLPAGNMGVCIRLCGYMFKEGCIELELYTSGCLYRLTFSTVAFALEGYRNLEDCLIKGFHLWSVQGVVSIDREVL